VNAVALGVGPDRDALKRAAAEAAVELVQDGMVVGLGTGSTAAFALEALARRHQQGSRFVGIPTSERTAAEAEAANIPLTSFRKHRQIDLTIDGADEVERGTLNLIKGLGGALLREKIVAAASRCARTGSGGGRRLWPRSNSGGSGIDRCHRAASPVRNGRLFHH
jgi:ribose 5-phosphate isomerase A